jgi:hypothetical protein
VETICTKPYKVAPFLAAEMCDITFCSLYFFLSSTDGSILPFCIFFDHKIYFVYQYIVTATAGICGPLSVPARQAGVICGSIHGLNF